jgi:hypothetical protein
MVDAIMTNDENIIPNSQISTPSKADKTFIAKNQKHKESKVTKVV